jgi:hypothetical protein
MKNQIAKTEDKNQVVVHEDPMLAMIDKVCTSPDFDITKMEKLIEMRNAELSRLAEKEFHAAFAEMQHELPRIITSHTNKQTNSKYAKIEDVNDAVLPILHKHGFAVSFRVVFQDDEKVTIQATLSHKEGHKESNELTMPYDNKGAQGSINKTKIHATGSTITYAKRYALCMLLDISTGEDTDGNIYKYISPALVKELEKLIDETGVDKIKFVSKFMKAPSITQIPEKDYAKAVSALKEAKAKRKGSSNANS